MMKSTHISSRIILAAYFVSLYFVSIDKIHCIRILAISVPRQVVNGQTIQLLCQADLERDELYSLKWFHNQVEFASFIPSKVPALEIYPRFGVNVNGSLSTGTRIVLDTVDLGSEGFWACEVSSERTFQRETKGRFMQVVVLAVDNPRIMGAQWAYDIGDLVNVTCLAPEARPVPLISWLINGEPAPAEYIIAPVNKNNDDNDDHDGDHHHHPPPQAQAQSWLQFQVQVQHLMSGKLTIKCSVSVNYVSSNILGLKSPAQYYLGEMVHVNCTYIDLSSRPSTVRVHWLLHQRKVHSQHVVRYKNANIVGLKFTIEPFHLDYKQQLALRCKATRMHFERRDNNLASLSGEMSLATKLSVLLFSLCIQF